MKIVYDNTQRKGKVRQPQLSFMLYYYITLMHNMFRLKYEKPLSAKFRVPYVSYHVGVYS